jgi:hypothetical protein
MRVHPPRLSKVGPYRAERSTRCYQDSTRAVWDTLRLTSAFQPRRHIVAPAAVGCKRSLARARGPKRVGCIALLAGLPVLAPGFIDGFSHENKDPTDRCEVT